MELIWQLNGYIGLAQLVAQRIQECLGRQP
jgi:hypothetical protein